MNLSLLNNTVLDSFMIIIEPMGEKRDKAPILIRLNLMTNCQYYQVEILSDLTHLLDSLPLSEYLSVQSKKEILLNFRSQGLFHQNEVHEAPSDLNIDLFKKDPWNWKENQLDCA